MPVDISKLKVIYLHGNRCKTWYFPLFQPYLKRELIKLGFKKENVFFETIPDKKTGRKEFWFKFIESKNCDKNTILIGRSTGTLCAMRWAEKNKIFGTILISPYSTNLHSNLEEESHYFNKNWSWDAIKKNNLNFIVQINSIDDNRIPQKEFYEVSKMLNLKGENHIILKSGKHFSKKVKLPEVIEILKKKLDSLIKV